MFFEYHAKSLGGLFESSASLSSFLKFLIKLLGIFSAIARKQGLEGLFIEREFFGKILTTAQETRVELGQGSAREVVFDEADV